MKKVNSIGILIMSAVFLIFGIVMAVLPNMEREAYEEAYKSNNLLIGDLYDDLAELEEAIENTDDVEIVMANLKSCAELGKRVADLQTNYQYLSPSEDEAAFMDNVNALDICFDEFHKNARVPWYSVSVPETANWTWEFQSTYEFASRRVNVIWLCYENDTENLLAYATGIYDSDTNLFSDIVYIMTSLGADYYYEDPTAGIGNSESGDVGYTGDDDNNDMTDPTVGEGETVPGEITDNPSDDPTQPTDENGETLPDAPDDVGGGGVADIDGGDRFGS